MTVRRRLEATTLLVTMLVATAAARADVERPSLRDALTTLRESGLNLIFSNALVRPDFKVDQPVDAGLPPKAQAVALLEPHGLELEPARPGVWYVVRAAPAVPVPVVQRAPVAAERVAIIEEVVVSSPRYQLVRSSHEARRLDARELEVIPSIGRDPLRATQRLPGNASVGLSARAHMRGGNTNEVLYLVDGIELIEPFHMADFHALFSTISPSVVDSVDVYHAGFPAAFGSRLSGVVDMELTQAERPVEGRVNVDFVNASSHAQGQSGTTQWLVSARRSTLDYLLEHTDTDYGRPRFHDELMRLSWEGDDSDLTVGLLYGDDKLRLEDGSAGESARADYHNLASWIRANRTYSDSLALELTGTFTSIDNRRGGELNDAADAVGRLQESSDVTVAVGRGVIRWRPTDSWLVHAGLEAQHQSARFDVDIETRYGVLGETLQPVMTLVRDVSADMDGTLLTGFVSAQNKLSDVLLVEVGWRYDAQNVGTVTDRQFSPRIQLTYSDGARWQAFLNLGRYAQHQNLYELQLDDGLLELDDPQLADQLSIGTAWQAAEHWQIRLEAYWREVDDPWSRFENLYNRWVLLPELHADRVSLAPDQARAFGGEMLVDYRPRSTLRWSLSLALARAEERFGGDWRPRPWQQRRALRGNVDWRPGLWRIGVTAGFHSGWPTTSLIAEPLWGPERLYDQNLPDYFSLDLHAARRFDLPQSELEVYFDLTNATFAKHVGGYRYESEETGLVRDDRTLLPAVPVLGLTWAW